DRSRVVDADAPAARMRRVAPVRDATDDDPTTKRYAALAARAERGLRRPSRRGGYLVARGIGCLIGPIVLLRFYPVMRHRGESGTGSIAALPVRVAAMPPSSTSAPSETVAAAQTVVDPTKAEQQTVATSTAVTAAPETPTSRPISSLPPSVSLPMASPSV